MINFEEGLIMTWHFPSFSALYMLLRASFRTLTLTISAKPRKTEKKHLQTIFRKRNVNASQNIECKMLSHSRKNS